MHSQKFLENNSHFHFQKPWKIEVKERYIQNSNEFSFESLRTKNECIKRMIKVLIRYIEKIYKNFSKSEYMENYQICFRSFKKGVNL